MFMDEPNRRIALKMMFEMTSATNRQFIFISPQATQYVTCAHPSTHTHTHTHKILTHSLSFRTVREEAAKYGDDVVHLIALRRRPNLVAAAAADAASQ